MYYCPGCESEDFEEFEADEDVVISEFTEDDYYEMFLEDR